MEVRVCINVWAYACMHVPVDVCLHVCMNTRSRNRHSSSSLRFAWLCAAARSRLYCPAGTGSSLPLHDIDVQRCTQCVGAMRR